MELDLDVACVYFLLHLRLVLDGLSGPAVQEVMPSLAAGRAPFVICSDDYLSDDVESRLMCSQAEHDQIRICSVNAVTLIGVVSGRGAFLPDELHDLMLPLARTVGIREDDSQVAPQSMPGESTLHVCSDCLCHIVEEGSAWCDDIGIEAFLINVTLNLFNLFLIDIVLLELTQQLLLLLPYLLSLHRCPEPSRTLLIHLSSWGNSINGQVEQLPRPNDVDDLIDVLEDVVALFLEIAGLFDVFSLGVAGRMDESVHVDVEVIDVGVATFEGLGLGLSRIEQDLRVAHAHPLKKHRHSHTTKKLL